MNFEEGDLVTVSYTANKAYIENGVFRQTTSPVENKLHGIVVSGHGVATSEEFVEIVPIGSAVPADAGNETLLRLDDPNWERPLTAECGLVRAFPRTAVESLNRRLSESNIQLINECLSRFLAK